MGDFLNRLSDKAGTMKEVGRINNKITTAKAEIAEINKDIARRCYELYREGVVEDEIIQELCAKIDMRIDMIQNFEADIEDVNAGYEERKAEAKAAKEAAKAEAKAAEEAALAEAAAANEEAEEVVDEEIADDEEDIDETIEEEDN